MRKNSPHSVYKAPPGDHHKRSSPPPSFYCIVVSVTQQIKSAKLIAQEASQSAYKWMADRGNDGVCQRLINRKPSFFHNSAQNNHNTIKSFRGKSWRYGKWSPPFLSHILRILHISHPSRNRSSSDLAPLPANFRTFPIKNEARLCHPTKCNMTKIYVASPAAGPL